MENVVSHQPRLVDKQNTIYTDYLINTSWVISYNIYLDAKLITAANLQNQLQQPVLKALVQVQDWQVS